MLFSILFETPCKNNLSLTPVFPDCTFATSVSSDESKFLEDFMTFASDMSSRTLSSDPTARAAADLAAKERPHLTELTVCDRTGNLSRPHELLGVQGGAGVAGPGAAGMGVVQGACTVTSLASLPGQYGGYGQKDGAFGQKDGGYGQKDAGYGQKDGGFGQKDTGYGQKDAGYVRSKEGMDGGYGQHQHRDKYPGKRRLHSYSEYRVQSKE